MLFKTEADRADFFLEAISTKWLVVMSHMADASDDGLCYVRLGDAFDKIEPATLNNDLYCFLLKIVQQYIDGKVTQTFGYTSYMLETLRRNPIVVQCKSDRAKFKTLGFLVRCRQHVSPTKCFT